MDADYMTPEAQRIAIAEAFVNVHGVEVEDWLRGEGEVIYGTENLPDYLNDLNAMHEAEKVFGPFGTETWAKYARNIRQGDIVALSGELLHATAAQRAQAFLMTLGLWRDS